jgi:transcriptional regulator with XRE-family HTH domain
MTDKTDKIPAVKDKTYPWTVIESLRAQKNISKKFLAEKLGLSYGYLVDLLNGRYSSKIDSQSIEIIAQVFEIPVRNLMASINTAKPSALTDSSESATTGANAQDSLISLIPLNSGTLLGSMTEDGLQAENIAGYITRPVELKDLYAFGVILNDETMQPPCQPGSIFIVSPQQTAQLGDLVLIMLQNGRAWLGELKEHNTHQVVLKHYNPKYTLVTLETSEITFIYPVVCLFFNS